MKKAHRELFDIKLLRFFFVALCFIVLNCFMGMKVENAPDWCDYKVYWQLGKEVFSNGGVSYASLSSSFRGTILPTIYGIMYFIGTQIFSSETLGFIVGSSAVYSILYALLLPSFSSILGMKFNRISLFGLIFLSFIFWYGLFLYPLSDVLAFMFIVITCICIKKQMLSEVYYSYFLWGGGIGASLYCAYNIRTMYLFAVPFVFFAVYWFNKCNKKKLAGSFLGMFVGVGISCIPQIIANMSCHGIFSIFNVGGGHLILSQLSWGITMQRYETYVGAIGNYPNYPNYSIVFEDPIGIALLEKANIQQFDSILQYIKFVFLYLFDMIGVYTRHLFNALCPCYPELYIKNVWREKILLCLTNSWILYYFGYVIYWKIKLNSKNALQWCKNNMLFCFIIIVPCLAIIPGAVEARFFYPVFMLIYLVVIYGISERGTIKSFIDRWYLHLGGYLLIMVPAWTIWANTFAQMRYWPLLYTR